MIAPGGEALNFLVVLPRLVFEQCAAALRTRQQARFFFGDIPRLPLLLWQRLGVVAIAGWWRRRGRHRRCGWPGRHVVHSSLPYCATAPTTETLRASWRAAATCLSSDAVLSLIERVCSR